MSKTEQTSEIHEQGNSSLGVVMYSGFDIQVLNILPIEKTLKACDVEFKMEIEIPTGEFTHVIKQGNRIFVSKDVYEKLKNHYT